MEEKFFEYAPIIVVIIAFLISYNVFVTPKQMDEIMEKSKKDLKDDFDKKIEDIKDDYVRKEVHDLAINEMKEDLKEVKQDVKDMKNMLMQAKGVV